MSTSIRIADKAVNTTYQDKTGTTSGSGTGAKFDVTKTNGVYDVDLDTAGTGYAAGDTITIQGSQLGGVNTTNDLILTVATVGTGGAIATFGDVGTGRVGDGTVDVLIGITGTDAIDTYVFDGDSADFLLTNVDGDILATSALTNVEFTLQDHERVTFNDKSVAFDLVDGAAGDVYSLLGAALGVSDITPELMGAGLYLKELGWTNKQIAEKILSTDTYKHDAGGISNETFAKHVWKNVFGVNGSYQDIQDVVYVIEHYGYSQADVLLVAANRAEFQSTIDLVGLSLNGVEYTPYVA